MAFSDPIKNLESLSLSEGAVVADLGAGSGFYTVAAAQLVQAHGKVYAVDVQQDLLSRLKNTAHEARLTNIEYVHGNAEKIGGTRIRDNSVDVVLACNIFFQIEEKENFLAEAKRILKPSGRILLVDWEDSFGGMGPQPQHVVAPTEAREYLQKAGFTKVSDIDAGEHHYGFIYRKQS